MVVEGKSEFMFWKDLRKVSDRYSFMEKLVFRKIDTGTICEKYFLNRFDILFVFLIDFYRFPSHFQWKHFVFHEINP